MGLPQNSRPQQAPQQCTATSSRANSPASRFESEYDRRQFVEEVRRRTDIVALISRRTALTPMGQEFKGLCPAHIGKSPKLHVNRAKGTYVCRVCQIGGDAFSWVMLCEGCTFPEAVNKLAVEAGLAKGAGLSRTAVPTPKPVVTAHDPAEEARKRKVVLDLLRTTWREALPVSYTPAETYLNARGLFAHLMPGGAWPLTFRYHPKCLYIQRDPVTDAIIAKHYFPALLGAVQSIAGHIVGLDRIYLNADGTKLKRVRGLPIDDTKKMTGTIKRNALRLGPATPVLNIAEGLETAATVAMGCGAKSSVWAGLSLSNWILDLPAVVQEVALWVDSDESDRQQARAAIQAAAEYYAAQHIVVRIVPAPEGKDWNDVLRENMQRDSITHKTQVAA